MVPGGGLVSHIIPSLVFVQIDWPAPQDKKKECAAKGKNNQVRHRAERLMFRSAGLQSAALQADRLRVSSQSRRSDLCDKDAALEAAQR